MSKHSGTHCSGNADEKETDKTNQPCSDTTSCNDKTDCAAGGSACGNGGQPEKPEPEAGSSNEQLEKLEAECKSWKEQYLRKAADFDNYRKRMLREKQEAVDYANTNLLLDLVKVLDDFDRAVEAGKSASSGTDGGASAFTEGVLMIKTQMESMLETKYGLSCYNSKGEVFDPNIHEAVAMNPSDSVKEPTVGEEFQKGYKLKERVIRHAKVMVLMPAAKQDDKAEQTGNTADKNAE